MTRPGGGQSTGGQGVNIPAIVGEEITAQTIAAGQAPVAPGAALIDIQGELVRILGLLTAVNDIRAQIIRLGLNPALRIAIDTEVVPVLNILSVLATAADFFSVAAFNLSNIVFAKTHEVKKILDLIYNITDISEDVLEVVIKLVLITLPKAPF
jgi:hypothetical protein